MNEPQMPQKEVGPAQFSSFGTRILCVLAMWIQRPWVYTQ